MNKNSLAVRILGLVLIICGAAVMLRVAVLLRSNDEVQQQANQECFAVLEALQEMMPETPLEDPSEEYRFPSLYVNEHDCVGILSIPELDLTLPIGGIYESTEIMPHILERGTMIIEGPSYEEQFGKLEHARMGMQVFFTDINGAEYEFEATTVEKLTNTQAGSGQMQLYYFVGRNKRFSIGCERIR